MTLPNPSHPTPNQPAPSSPNSAPTQPVHPTQPASSNHYQRTSTRAPNGLLRFATPQDRQSEQETALLLGRLWNCEIKSFGLLSPVDFFAVREGLLIGVLELKTRTHASTTFNTVFLNLRKWGSLMLYHFGLGCPALYVIRFTDGYRWISITEVDASKWTIGGTKTIVKSHTDIEPVILVPVDQMHPIFTPRDADF